MFTRAFPLFVAVLAPAVESLRILSKVNDATQSSFQEVLQAFSADLVREGAITSSHAEELVVKVAGGVAQVVAAYRAASASSSSCPVSLWARPVFDAKAARDDIIADFDGDEFTCYERVKSGSSKLPVVQALQNLGLPAGSLNTSSLGPAADCILEDSVQYYPSGGGDPTRNPKLQAAVQDIAGISSFSAENPGSDSAVAALVRYCSTSMKDLMSKVAVNPDLAVWVYPAVEKQFLIYGSLRYWASAVQGKSSQEDVAVVMMAAVFANIQWAVDLERDFGNSPANSRNAARGEKLLSMMMFCLDMHTPTQNSLEFKARDGLDTGSPGNEFSIVERYEHMYSLWNWRFAAFYFGSDYTGCSPPNAMAMAFNGIGALVYPLAATRRDAAPTWIILRGNSIGFQTSYVSDGCSQEIEALVPPANCPWYCALQLCIFESCNEGCFFCKA